MIINREVSEYLEKLGYLAHTAEREFNIARKLRLKSEIIQSLCKSKEAARIKYQSARNELTEMLNEKYPTLKNWTLNFETREVAINA